ncbi:DnaJ domain-containing protein [Artemisia annua]|uniref:DnaJ domain-containing protein n=1 Tax=Artemisia annua TaxID=35608 RepID=A0A2U1KCA2_ARTAN|nr:DnaJ domain-containing protein [Artemisia annua]
MYKKFVHYSGVDVYTPLAGGVTDLTVHSMVEPRYPFNGRLWNDDTCCQKDEAFIFRFMLQNGWVYGNGLKLATFDRKTPIGINYPKKPEKALNQSYISNDSGRTNGSTMDMIVEKLMKFGNVDDVKEKSNDGIEKRLVWTLFLASDSFDREGAVAEKVREAHSKVTVANHPDAASSHYLPTKINETKDVMLGKSKNTGYAFVVLIDL